MRVPEGARRSSQVVVAPIKRRVAEAPQVRLGLVASARVASEARRPTKEEQEEGWARLRLDALAP